MGYGILREEPVTIEVKSGEVANVSGGKAADYLRETLKAFNDRSAYNLAEFAVGLNPASRAYATNLEDLGKTGFWSSRHRKQLCHRRFRLQRRVTSILFMPKRVFILTASLYWTKGN